MEFMKSFLKRMESGRERSKCYSESWISCFFDKTPTNPYGHVAIVDDGSTSTSLIVVEQNAGSGNGNGIGANAITRRTVEYTARA